MFRHKVESLKDVLQKFHFGELATSNFYISIIAGIGLAFVYDNNEPLKSISQILISDYYASFLRNLHYWSSNLFLIFTFFHLVDHLLRNSDKKVKSSVWLHLVFSILLVFYLMLSGFILKGDIESLQASRILSSLLQSIPLIGKQISYLFIGDGKNFQIIYFHHIATATIILLFFAIEHSRLFLPQSKIFLIAILLSSVLSLIFTPLPVDEFSNILKGPWYFVGIQEILHNLSKTFILVLFIIILLSLLYILKFVRNNFRKIINTIFAVVFIVYLIFNFIGSFLRGENWEWSKLSYQNLNSNFEINKFFYGIDDKYLKTNENKFINGRAEGCLNCHRMEGLTNSHNPDSIGCFGCHRGNPFSLSKELAHKNLIKIPGNLENAKLTCGNSACHPDLFYRVNNSIMTTMSGIVSVNKFVFDELNSPEGIFRIKDIGHSPAETHLRNLCVSCHLSNEKKEYGRINQNSRGGGCLACHLNYSTEAENQLNIYSHSKIKENNIPKVHPSIDLKITNEHCFGCHSRSGRISTNYEGWSEILPEEHQSIEKQIMKLEDGRIFIKQEEDVHHKAGMDCIDCHISLEVMGDGNIYSHKEDQVKIKCEDCHSEKLNIVHSKDFDYETNKIIKMRGFSEDTILLGLNKSKITFTNQIKIERNKVFLITKNSQRKLELRKPSEECRLPAHQNLSCQSCHTSWVSNCITCHTNYDKNADGFDWLENKYVKGSWIETAGNFEVDFPTLGIVKDKEGNYRVSTFVPGMIIKINSEKFTKPKFKRLFAPAFSHTITKQVRSCKSCHLNPKALGFGDGKFETIKLDNGMRLEFIPKNKLNPIDLLPIDAWIGFNKNSSYSNSTRISATPLPKEIQERILNVGVCLTCHDEKSKVMKKALIDFEKVFQSRKNQCLTFKF